MRKHFRAGGRNWIIRPADLPGDVASDTQWIIDQRKADMPKREVSSDAIRKPVGVFSQATVVEAKGKLVFISGMTARRSDGSIAGIGDITAQTRRVFENLSAVCAAAGGSLSQLVRVGIYLTDLANFAAVNAVMAEYFKEPYPARSTIGVSALPRGAEVEIDAVLVIG